MALQDSFNSTQANGNRVGSPNQWGQLFTTGSAYDCTSVKVKIGRRTGTATNVVVELFAVSSGLPTGSALASGNITFSTVTNSTDYANFPYYEATFASPVSLTSGTQYAIVVSVPDGSYGSNYIYWNGNYTTGLYSGGDPVYSNNSGSSYTEYSDRDFGFEVYGDTLPAGWTGKINAKTNPSKIKGIAVANIGKVNGI